jgi:hypothetical protein
MKAIKFLIARLKEPSTYAGIGAALAPFAQYSPRIVMFAAASGVLAFLLKENGSATPAAPVAGPES